MTALVNEMLNEDNIVCSFEERDKTILLIDDDIDVIESLASLLEIMTEYTILQAHSKEGTQAILEEHTPDVALIDIQLGQTSGLDLIPILRAKSADMVCVMNTAHRDVEYAVKAVKLGANEYLFKPIEPNTLIANLKKYLCDQDIQRKQHKKQQDTLQKAHLDELTGLAKRDLLEFAFDKIKAKAKREGGCFSLLYIDLDHFKELNDTLGHKAGDQLLKSATEKMLSCLREDEILARMGGDEFVILLSIESDLDVAQNVAQRILDSIESIPLQPGQKNKVTASIGIANFSNQDDSFEQLLEKADQAMYRSKNSGKNKYSI